MCVESCEMSCIPKPEVTLLFHWEKKKNVFQDQSTGEENKEWFYFYSLDSEEENL